MKALWAALPILILSCTLAQVNVEVLSERTALENQILGTYNALDDEMLLLASVRAVDAAGNLQEAPPRSRESQDTATAYQVLAFHEDDLFAFKKLRWVGENNQGLLTLFSLEKINIPEDLKDFADRYSKSELESVVSQINSAREYLYKRVIDLNENLNRTDMETVRSIFGKLNTENALPGEMIQDDDGTWSRKP